MTTATRRLRLVGRGQELARLEAELKQSLEGELRCVLLLADPGVGKSRLAAEVLNRHRRTVVGLSARAYPLGATASFGLWVEALERHFASLSADEIRSLCGGVLDDLAGLMRSVAAVRGSVPAREAPRQRLLQALTMVLRNLALRTPLVLVLDDVHLADASSWEALGYLAHNLTKSRILVLAAARPAELGQQPLGTDTVLGLEQEGLLSKLNLLPLGRDHVRELAEAILEAEAPEELVEWLTERSGGYPLFAIGLLRGLLDEGVTLAAPRLSRLPESLSERVMSRLQLLDEPARATLEVLAVVGRRVEFNELVQLSGRPGDRLATILETLVRMRFVAEEERGRELIYEVAHPLMQETIYQEIGGARRRAIHRLVARAMVGLGQRAAAASHYARCASVGEAEAIDALIDALRQAEERESHREAMTILDGLLELLPSGDERWLRVLDAMSWDAEWVVDHQADLYADIGVRAMREIERCLAGSSDLARQAVVQGRLTSFRVWHDAEATDAIATGRRAQALFRSAEQPRRALLAEHEISWIGGIAGDLAGQERAARDVIRQAESAGDRLALVHALGALGWPLFWQGRFADAEVAFRRSESIARQDGKHYRLAWSLSSLAYAFALEGRMGEAKRLLRDARGASPAYADSAYFGISAHTQWLAGDFADAVTTWRESAAWSAGRLSARRGWSTVIAAASAPELGRLQEAQSYLDAAAQVYSSQVGFGWRYLWHWAAGVLAREKDDLVESLASLRRARDGLWSMGALPAAAAVLADLVEVAAAIPDVPSLREAAGQLHDTALRLDRDLYRALAAIGSAWLRLVSADGDAVASARTAAMLLSGLDYRAFHARALDVLGRALAPTDRPAAADALQQAAAIFATCQATRRRDRALAALAGMGHPGRRALGSAQGPADLTAREGEVIDLALQGHSAREIGRRLFIGERTVETHLANAYAKLGVDSRVELVRRYGAAREIRTSTEETRPPRG